MYGGQPASKRARDDSMFSDLSGGGQALTDCILNPEGCDSEHRWPNTLGKSSVYKTKNVINAAFDANGRSMVAVYPRLNNAVFTTAGRSYTEALGPQNTSTYNPYSQDQIDLPVAIQQIAWTAPFYFAGGYALFPRPSTTITTFPYAPLYPFTVSATGGTPNLAIWLSNASAQNILVTVTTYNSSGIVIGSESALNINTFNTDLVLTPIFTTAVAYFSIIITLGQLGIPYQGSVVLSLYDSGTGTGYVIPNVSQFCNATDLKDSATIGKSATMAFVEAQSLLITFEGSTLNNGGQLAIARIPGDSSVGIGTGQQFNDWYSWIASLSDNNHDGPIKMGGYCWYLSQDERGYFYRNIGDLAQAELPYMVAEFTTDDNSETNSIPVARVKVVSVIQFVTNSSVYSKAPAPYIGDDERKIRWILSNTPAAFENGSHISQLKGLLGALGNRAMSVISNPRTYKALAGAAKAFI